MLTQTITHPITFAPTTLGNRPSPDIVGIWKLGKRAHASEQSRLFLAQPADSTGNPRHDYMLRTTTDDRSHRNESLAQLSRFTSAAAAVSHPNLIVVLDSSLESTTPFLVMPRLTGATLKAVMQMSRPQALPVILWTVRQAAQALDALHAGGWIHGDIKPANLFVSGQGHMTVLDLGFARPIGSASDGSFRGTPKYAATEHSAQTPAPAAAAADIFSLGNVLLELLAWSSPTIRERSRIEPIADLIAEMIATDPTERPTATEITQRLLRLEIETLGEHIQPQSLRKAA